MGCRQGVRHSTLTAALFVGSNPTTSALLSPSRLARTAQLVSLRVLEAFLQGLLPVSPEMTRKNSICANKYQLSLKLAFKGRKCTIGVMANMSAFQAEDCGFESHMVLSFRHIQQNNTRTKIEFSQLSIFTILCLVSELQKYTSLPFF